MLLRPKPGADRGSGSSFRSRRTIVNLGSLASIQVSNAFAPLIAYPFVLAMVGQDSFAQLVVAEAIALFLLSFVLYSFEVDGVASVVGIKAGEHQTLSRIFSSILLLRLAFYCGGLLILQVALTFAHPELRIFVFGWSLVGLSYAIQPNWLFQGLERNLPLAVFVTLSRFSALATVFVLVRSEDDAILLPFILGGWYVAGAIGALTYSIIAFKIRPRFVDVKQLGRLVWNGKEVYLNSVATSFYKDSNLLILSILGVPAAGIASYSLAEKLTKAFQASMRPLNQLFFPRALAIASEEVNPSPQAFKRIFAITAPQIGVALVLLSMGAISYIVFAPFIAGLQKVEGLEVVFLLTLIMALSVLPGVGVFMLGIAGLNALGERRYMLRALMIAGMFSIVANLLLVPHFEELASAVCFLITEILLFVLIVRRYR